MHLDKEDSAWLKGIAVLLMLWHHLFAFPERIVPPASYLPLLAGVDVEGLVAQFGKICVPVFLFLSGYGVAHIARSDARHHVERALAFLKIYWFYFVCLIPIGLFFFPELRTFDSGAQRFDPSPTIFIANLLGVSSTYIGEWWFVEPYLLLTLASPWLTRALMHPRTLAVCSLLVFLASAALLRQGIDTPVLSLVGLAYWQWPFVAGMLACHFARRRREPSHRDPDRTRSLPALLAITVLIAALWAVAGKVGLVLATPLFVFLAAALRPAGTRVDAALLFVGRYSLAMWLTHTALCYYYAQPLVFAPRFSLLVFANLVVLSLLLGMALEALRTRLFKAADSATQLVLSHRRAGF